MHSCLTCNMCQAMKNKAFLGAIGLGWNGTLQEH